MDNGASSYRRFLDGDESGLVEIIRDYKDGLILYLNSFTGNIRLAEELAEDTFVKLGIKRPKDKGKGSFRTWLYAIGRNIAVDYLRRRRKEVSVEEFQELAAEEADLERAYLRQEQKVELHRALKRLKPEYRQILWLTYFDGCANKEAAAILGKSVHSVETLVYRARLALKSELVKEGFPYEEL